MNPTVPKPSKGPESKIQEALVLYLRAREWIVRATHGNTFQSGFPDLYCAHARYGARWIEVKNSAAYSFTPAQREFFPLLSSAGIGVWILIAATEDEYLKLWQPANWHHYLEVGKTITRPRPSLKDHQGYIPKYPIIKQGKE